MKVPHQILGRTRPSSAGLDPIRVQVDPDAFGAGLARGAENLAVGFEVAAAQVKQREDKTNRFQAMTNYSDFEIEINGQLAELKKGADPTGKGFTMSAAEMYDAAASKFLGEKVAPEVREEARYWLSNTKQRIIGDSMTFQYEAGNAFFRAGIDKEYQRALAGLDPATGGDPARIEEYRASLAKVIDESDLSVIEKQKLKWDTSVGIEGVVYKQAYKAQLSGAGGGVKSLIRHEEGFRSEPYWDTNAWRIGYGSDTVTRADGTHVKVQPGMRVTREEAELDLDYRLNEVEGARPREQVGDRAWGALSPAAQAALRSVAYNYGSLPPVLVNTIKSGASADEIANVVAGLDANPDRRKREAAMIRRGGGAPDDNPLDSSPLFSHLPYEDRISLQNDGQSEFTREENARAEQEKLRINTLTNDLLNGINDGVKGQTEIDAARAEGWLSDYDTIKKAQDLYEKKNEEGFLVARTLEKAASGRTFDPTDEDDKKGLNAVIGKGGIAQLDGMNSEYLLNGVVPLVTQVQDIPTDVMGLLAGMVRSNNQEKGLWAFEALSALQDASPEAFNNRVSDALAADVNFYRQRRTAVPADQLFEAINGGRTQAERQGRALLYEEAQTILKTKEEGVATVSSLVQDVVSGFDGWTSSAEQISAPAFAKQLMFDYDAAFTDYYVTRDPNKERAHEWATKQIQRDWAVSEAGGGILMKHPPELAGYPKMLGGYDWINVQTREMLQLGEGESYQLISDDKTASELVKFRQGLGPAPSYQVVTIDKSGVPRLKMFERMEGAKGEETFIQTGNPARLRFEKNQVHRAIETYDLTTKILDAKIGELDSELQLHMTTRTPPPLELTQERERLINERNAVQAERDERFPAKPVKPLPAEEQPWQGLSPTGVIPGM